MSPHTTSDDPTRYRHSSEVEVWRLRDPIERLKVFLARQGIADRSYFDQIEHEADGLARLVREGVRSLPDPPPAAMFDNVYAEPHSTLAQQRREFVEYEASFVEGAHA
jgi:2-oxoisovalerate dehydrogenase E1 component alpha subunit